MKKLVILVIAIQLVVFAESLSVAGENSGIVALDSQTIVMTDGKAVYLLEIDNGKVILKDSILIYSVQAREGFQFDADKAVYKRLKLEKR